MKKKILGLLVALVMVFPVLANAEEVENLVKIGETGYPTLKEAVEAVEPCEGEATCEATTITVLKDSSTKGIVFESGKNLIIDFAGHTVTFIEPTVGSKGTETNDMQLLKNSTIVFKNGTIKSSNTEKSKIFIQNYANLTLKDMTILATNELNQYAVSNNSGVVSIEGKTTIKTSAVAFDIYGWYGSYANGPQVTVDTTGTIEGDIEVATDGKTATKELKLVIKNINHVGEMSIQEGLEDNVTVEGGTYTDEAAAEKLPVVEGSEVYGVANIETGEVKYVVATEEEIEQDYFKIDVLEDEVEDYLEYLGEENVKLIEDALGKKYIVASYSEIYYVGMIDGNIVLDESLVETELENGIKVTMDIPTALPKLKEGFVRNYVVIRLHENSETGKMEVSTLDAEDNGNGTVTFETDKFSTYVLAYEDVEAALTTNPNTFDGIGLYMILGSLSLISLVAISVYYSKKKALN